jgi:hypothetical protein
VERCSGKLLARKELQWFKMRLQSIECQLLKKVVEISLAGWMLIF